ncbi:MAG: DUF86 domain-containing protein [Syntrophobacterales bacterium]
MWQDKDLVRLRHMLDHAREAVGLIQNKSRADLTSDRLLGLALVRLMEIIGEAANRVSLEYQSQHPSIPWSQIISLRNRLMFSVTAPAKKEFFHWRAVPALHKKLTADC